MTRFGPDLPGEAPPYSVEAVRRRPAMYVGNMSERGIFKLFDTVMANSVEEALYGGADRVGITCHTDGSLSIEDNGRGIPLGIDPDTNLPFLTLACTDRKAGSRLRPANEPRLAHGMVSELHVVNALSERFEITSRRDGRTLFQRFARGVPVEAPQELPPSGSASTGTTIRWLPDPEVMATTDHRPDLLRSRLRTLACLVPGLRFHLRDEVEGRDFDFYAPGGAAELVELLNTGRRTFDPPVRVVRQQGPIFLDVAVQYHFLPDDPVLSFANLCKTERGGFHERGLHRALQEILTPLARKAGRIRGDQRLTLNGIQQGLTAVVSVRLPGAQFEGMYADRLGNQEVEALVFEAVTKDLHQALERDLTLFSQILCQLTANPSCMESL